MELQAGINLFQGKVVPNSLIGVAKNELGFQVLDKILLIWDFSKLFKVKPVNITCFFGIANLFKSGWFITG